MATIGHRCLSVGVAAVGTGCAVAAVALDDARVTRAAIFAFGAGLPAATTVGPVGREPTLASAVIVAYSCSMQFVPAFLPAGGAAKW